MATSKEVDGRVNRFVAEILGLVEQARGERRAAALSAVSTMLADPRAMPAASRPASTAKPAKTPNAITGTKRRGRPPGANAAPMPESARRARHPRLNIVPAASAVVTDPRQQDLFPPAPMPATTARAPVALPVPAAQDASDRKANVLEAVRALVRPTARDVAERCGLPNPATYAALRALVDDGKLARTDGVRGQEYSLVSSGGIRPSKRNKRTPPQGPAPQGELLGTAETA